MITKYLDTNVVLRLILRDNLDQFEVIADLLKQANERKIELFISTVVVFESEWVLRSFYKIKKQDICLMFSQLFLIAQLNFENREIISQAIELLSTNNIGLEDNYHFAFCQNQDMELVTFDKQLSKKSL
jgi:predicted nucleic-acid-binding protein